MKTLLVALTLLALAGPARAQIVPAPQGNAAVASGDAEWALRVSPRLVAALRSPSPAARAKALHAIGTLAYASAEGADLRPAVPALLDVFRADPDERLRVMALRALEATADGEVMAALRAEAGRETHPYVQRTLLAVLVGHYGAEALQRDTEVVAMAQSLRERPRLALRASAARGRLVAAR